MATSIAGKIVVAPRSVGGWIVRFRRSWRQWPVIPVSLLLLVVVTGIGADWIAPHDPENGDLSDRNLPPSGEGPP